MDFYSTVYELIDLRSFSNLWYWIMLALVWSTASHFVIGVPFDMLARAARHGGQVEKDLLDLARINSGRIIYIAETAGMWLTGITFFIVTGLAILGFYYWIEFAQAVFFLFAPMSLIFAISIRTARFAEIAEFSRLRVILRRHRIIVQVIGLFSILITSMWGMYINITVGAL